MKFCQLFPLLFSFALLTGCKVSYNKNVPAAVETGGSWGGDYGGGGSAVTGVYLNAKVCLEGAVDSTSLEPLEMFVDLNDKGFLPYVTPYTLAAPWSHYSVNDIALTGGVYNPSINGDPAAPVWVDWVLVEVYSFDGLFYSKVDAQSALLLWDGTLYNSNGAQGLYFPTLAAGDYFLNIKHRNHLAIATQSAVSLTIHFEANTFQADFTDPTTLLTGISQPVGAIQCMAAGDIDGDFDIDADDLSAVDAQVNAIVLGAVDGTTITGYFNADMNFDGQIENDSSNDTVDHGLIENNPVFFTAVHPNVP